MPTAATLNTPKATAPSILILSSAALNRPPLLAALDIPLLADDAALLVLDSPLTAPLAALAVPVKLALAPLAAVDTPPTALAALVVLDDKLVIAV